MNVIRRKIHTLMHTPRIWMKKFENSPMFSLLPDNIALKIQYKNVFLKDLNLDDPRTFNEKLQWLKLHNRKDEYSIMVDKYAAKEYVSKIIGEEHIIPAYGVWDSFEEIDFESLPNQFVLKCTHGSGDVVICRDKTSFDLNRARKTLTKALRTDYYKIGREWPYKNVPHRILAEQYVSDEETSSGLTDYKFFCFGGQPKVMFVATERYSDCKFDYFDMDFSRLPIRNIHPNSSKLIEKPKRFEEMKKIAEQLSVKVPFIRIDLYEINGEIYFGEYTFFHAGGFSVYSPEEWDLKMGEWIDLSFVRD